MDKKLTKVLVVEDDPDFAESLVIALGIRSCAVDVARTGEDAIRLFRKKTYDVAFMDIKLPGMNGVQSLQEILCFQPDARIVMMTGFSEASLLEKARQAGAMEVLRKPFRMRELLSIIDHLQQANGSSLPPTQH